MKKLLRKLFRHPKEGEVKLGDPPLTRFKGTLRQITPECLNDVGSNMLRICAPRFAPLNEEQREEAFNRHVERHGIDPNIHSWLVPTRQGRRFSGDLFPDEEEQYRLDVRCYHSVCVDAKGHDHDTLVNELNAYRDCNAEFYSIFFDCLGPFAKALDLPRSPHIGLLAYPSDKLMEALPTDVSAETKTKIQNAVKIGAPFGTTLGCVLAKAKIDGVLDLRQLTAQQWFFDTYVPEGPFPTEANDFIEILPELTKLDLGSWSENNRRTHAIGADLRQRGVSALIFPSARSNVHVLRKQDQIVSFGGWNIVRYKRSPDPRSFKHFDSGGWLTEFPYPRIKVERKYNKLGEEIGWKIDGLQDVNMFLYETAMMKKHLGLETLLRALTNQAT